MPDLHWISACVMNPISGPFTSAAMELRSICASPARDAYLPRPVSVAADGTGKRQHVAHDCVDVHGGDPGRRCSALRVIENVSVMDDDVRAGGSAALAACAAVCCAQACRGIECATATVIISW